MILIIGKLNASTQNINTGINQGSFLFIIYINDLPLYTTHINIDMYTDNTTIHVSGSYRTEIELKVQENLYNAHTWCLNNNMTANRKITTCYLVHDVN